LNATSDWRELLRQPGLGDHVVQVYQDDDFLEEALSGYLRPGLAAGEAALLIAVPGHRERFASLDPAAVARGQMVLLDAEEMLDAVMRDGLPDRPAFHRVVGGAIAKLRLEYPAVRAYGEMVDVLWQRGSREAAIRLEERWNELLRLHAFTLLCAYRIDPLDAGSYGGPLESICGCHSHLIPARDYARLDEAVAQATRDALDETLAGMLLSLAARSRPGASMPLGQATLLWLRGNMPLTAKKVLAGVRARC
jgi:hypothetical protein